MNTTLPAPQATRTGLLIGGHALAQLGSSRHTEDVDYLINDPGTREMFLHDEAANVDYINANGHQFFAAVWKAEAGNKTGRATPQSLLELKAFAFVQHCLNRKFQKADDAEYDIKFLVRTFGLKKLKIAPKFLGAGELHEVNRVIASTRV
ncbi:hypothetical protein GKZ68_20765 (plasmid) [Hymenobacter sp. BRD128]|uniref:hypothetical protein n=1 Tax=Hymenobacter sp. BRD128 TaxID=2675878 RepID=UPI00156785B2|nr:hypothetical protein [Hymenobacter sp. BRD128]QKG59117.1 hypothetical protein GKZ68_20765 [Hymenobacter sp. BRD128]